MSKRFLKLIVCILLVCLVIGTVSACTKKGDEDVSQEPSEPSEVVPEDTDEDEPLVITFFRNEPDVQPLHPDSPVLDEIKRITGVEVKIESVPSSDYDEKKKILLSTGGDLPDIIRVFSDDAKEYGPAGVFLELTQYNHLTPTMNEIMEKEVPEFKKILVEGKLYYFPSTKRHFNTYGTVPIIRTDIMKQLGFSNPDTFDDLYQILKKMKDEYPESYPWTSRGTSSLISAAAYSMGSGTSMYYDADIDGGRYIYGPTMPEFKEVLEYFSKLYAEGLIDPDYAVNSTSIMIEKMSTGKSFFYYDNGSFVANIIAALKSDDPNATAGTFPVLKNSKGIRRNWLYETHEIGVGFAVSAKTKYPERVVKFMDWMYTDEAADLTNFGIEGVHYTKENGEYKISEELVEKYSKESDPWRSFMSPINGGQLGFCIRFDERSQWPFMDDDVRAIYDQWASDPGMREELQDPPFTKDELSRVAKLQTAIETIYERNIDRFIMGELPLDAYDDVVKEMMDAGVEELENIYNEALRRLD
jgi:putative aldouronate transport system substrate-binding protein